MARLPDAGFDAVAPFYDRLAKVVFGNSLQKAQLANLDFIPEGASVLVIGGGSGWILQQLINQNRCRQIVYLEASAKMLDLTSQVLQKNNQANTIVDLRLGTEKDLLPQDKFDVIITYFLLDLFAAPRLKSLIATLYKKLRAGGLWLVADFRFIQQKRPWWQQALLKSMYLFFKLTCQIEASRLADWSKVLEQQGLTKIKSELFYNQMIEAVVYRKDEAPELA